MKQNIFEKATKNKIRFGFKGVIGVEDLWDLSVTDLDKIFKTLNATKRQSSEDSLLSTPTSENTILTTQIEIVTYIVTTKLAEQEARLLYADKQNKKQKIMSIIANKQDGELEAKSLAELQKELDSL